MTEVAAGGSRKESRTPARDGAEWGLKPDPLAFGGSGRQPLRVVRSPEEPNQRS